MLHLSGLTEGDKAALRSMLTIPNPRRLQAQRFSGWVDRDMPKELTGYVDLPDSGFMIAPGAAAAAWHYFASKKRTPQYIQSEKAHHARHAFEYRGDFREYQDPVVDTVSTRSAAVAVGPCGSGKTDMALRVMARRDCGWLIVVHMRKLSKQWKERIEERVWARVGTTVSKYSPGRKVRWDPASPFVIATVQALREHPEDVVALAGEGRAVWVDECHHTPCSTFTDVLSLGAWRYRYGVTATPDRSDGTTALMHWWVGPVVARVNREAVEESGHLLRSRLLAIATGYRDTYDPKEPGDMQRLIDRLCDDRERMRLICEAVNGLWMHGRHILVCVDRIAYGERLADILADMGVGVELCHAKLPKSEQDNIMWEVANGHTRVVIATSLADEGLDLPILDTVVLATPSGSATRCEQRAGRACRPLAGKMEPLVVDIVDPLVQRSKIDPDTGETRVHRIFLNQFRRRYAVYRKIANCDHAAVKRLLKGTPPDDQSSRMSPG